MTTSRVITLTSRGATSGRVRTARLMRVEHGGAYAVVGSLGGSDTDPAWCHNLRAHPRVSLQDGKTTRDYDARELDGDEHAIWWARAVAAFPEYARFQRKTARRIPVFVLEPIDDGSSPRK